MKINIADTEAVRAALVAVNGRAMVIMTMVED
jgi:hypothetical protein